MKNRNTREINSKQDPLVAFILSLWNDLGSIELNHKYRESSFQRLCVYVD